jgi:hypothetical protein
MLKGLSSEIAIRPGRCNSATRHYAGDTVSWEILQTFEPAPEGKTFVYPEIVAHNIVSS